MFYLFKSLLKSPRLKQERESVGRFIIFGGTLLILFLLPFPVHSKERLVISTFLESPFQRLCQSIMEEAYRRAGMTFQIQHYPGERAVFNANAGRTDGELYRNARISQSYPNLVKVPIPITRSDIVAFTKEVHFQVEGWESLRPYRIGMIRGFKVVEENTKGMKIRTLTVREQLFQMLASGRLDIAVEDRIHGIALIKKHDFKNVTILEPPLRTILAYHYLHKRHAHLVDPLAKALEEMQQSGMTQTIESEFFSKL